MEQHALLFPSPTGTGATWWQIQWSRLRQRLGAMLNRLGFGGLVKPLVFDDLVTGQHLEIRVSEFFTTISVDGRDYYFRRLNGAFDGTGMGCCPACPPQMTTCAPWRASALGHIADGCRG